eukprot:TRINITY_DN35805_c0_g2_i1.p1 TRINITY_DN35805_c0_g2~~TRINITY_DN35805_c0_g2_i1.p1  ORF type:complete len:101 (-),score=1.50 TRINITY_DN35805_c0_g2_i1:144-446(-)
MATISLMACKNTRTLYGLTIAFSLQLHGKRPGLCYKMSPSPREILPCFLGGKIYIKERSNDHRTLLGHFERGSGNFKWIQAAVDQYFCDNSFAKLSETAL